MRWVALPLVGALCPLAVVVPAAGEHRCWSEVRGGVVIRVCEDHGGDSGGDEGGGGGGPTVQLYAWPYLDGECVRFRYIPLEEIPDIAGYASGEAASQLAVAAYLAANPACPGEVIPTLTPELWVRSWLDSYPLPTPAPVIQPGRMLVGLPAYLEANTDMERSVPTPSTPFGPADLRLTSVLYVDWGDGTPEDGPFTTAGAPWPDGEITHTYTTKGFYDVVVRQEWTVAWSVGGDGGTIGPVDREGTLEDFPIEEREAVVTQ